MIIELETRSFTEIHLFYIRGFKNCMKIHKVSETLRTYTGSDLTFSYVLNMFPLKQISSLAKEPLNLSANMYSCSQSQGEPRRVFIVCFFFFFTTNTFPTFVHYVATICILSKHTCTHSHIYSLRAC